MTICMNIIEFDTNDWPKSNYTNKHNKLWDYTASLEFSSGCRGSGKQLAIVGGGSERHATKG